MTSSMKPVKTVDIQSERMQSGVQIVAIAQNATTDKPNSWLPKDTKMSVQKYQPRLSIEITQEQFNELQLYIPHGIKRQIFSVIVEDLLDLLRQSTKREAIFAAIISRMVNFPKRSLELEE